MNGINVRKHILDNERHTNSIQFQYYQTIISYVRVEALLTIIYGKDDTNPEFRNKALEIWLQKNSRVSVYNEIVLRHK